MNDTDYIRLNNVSGTMNDRAAIIVERFRAKIGLLAFAQRDASQETLFAAQTECKIGHIVVESLRWKHGR